MECPHCKFVVTPGEAAIDGGTTCPNCQRPYRLQPNPLHSEMEIRDTPDPGESDPGGNPLQEGILGTQDGGWKNYRVRDESFASVRKSSVDPIAKGYAEACLWCNDENPKPGEYQADPSHLQQLLPHVQGDVEDFVNGSPEAIQDAYADGYTPEQIGHDFYLTRNGHGAGFWDRGGEPSMKALDQAARVYGSSDDHDQVARDLTDPLEAQFEQPAVEHPLGPENSDQVEEMYRHYQMPSTDHPLGPHTGDFVDEGGPDPTWQPEGWEAQEPYSPQGDRCPMCKNHRLDDLGAGNIHCPECGWVGERFVEHAGSQTPGPNDCTNCGRDLGQGMCGFEKGPNGETHLLCLRCKEEKDPGSLKRGLDHPNIGMEVGPDPGPQKNDPRWSKKKDDEEEEDDYAIQESDPEAEMELMEVIPPDKDSIRPDKKRGQQKEAFLPALLALGARLLPGIGRIMGGVMKSGPASGLVSKLGPGLMAGKALNAVKPNIPPSGAVPQGPQGPAPTSTPGNLPIPIQGKTAVDLPSTQSIVPGAASGDPEDADTQEKNDGERDKDLQVGPNVNEIGGSDEGPDFDHQGEGAQSFEALLPKLLELLFSDQSGADDPEIQDLHSKLDAEIPGYLDQAGSDDDGAHMITILMGGDQPSVVDHGQADDPSLQDNDAPHDPLQEDEALKESRFSEHLAALPGVQPFLPMVDPSDPHPHPNQGKCPNCRSTLDPTSSLCPQCGMGNASTRMAADTQGPNTDEQKAAVAEALAAEGRHEEIPTMIMEPWKYADELSKIIGQDTPPDPTSDEGPQDPAAAPPGAAPPGAMPPGGAMPPPMGAPQQMMGAIRRYANQVDSLADNCPNCGSHSTGYDDDDGNCSCKTCHHQWKGESELLGDGNRTADYDEGQNVGAVPAADQEMQEDPSLEQDSAHTWQDTNGEPLKVNAEYKMHSQQYDIPDIIRITDVKSDSFNYTNVGEFGLGHDAEVSFEEAQLEGLQFEPFHGGGPEGIEDPGEQENMEDIGRPSPGQDQTDLSTPHMQMAKTAWDGPDTGYSGDFGDPYDDYYEEEQRNRMFADPGGNSALRAEGPGNPRNIPCPTCGRENMLTPEDQAHGYQCDYCADEAEGLRPQSRTSMTAKDFRLLAEAIKNSPVENQEELAHHFADHLQMTNPQFDRDRFVGAATGEPLSGRDKYNPENPREYGGRRPEPPPPPPDPLEEQFAQPSVDHPLGPQLGRTASPQSINLEPDWEGMRKWILNIARTDLQQAVKVNNEMASEALDVNALAQAAGVSPQEVEALSGGLTDISEMTGLGEAQHPLGPHTGAPMPYPVNDQSLTNGTFELPLTGQGVGPSVENTRRPCEYCGGTGAPSPNDHTGAMSGRCSKCDGAGAFDTRTGQPIREGRTAHPGDVNEPTNTFPCKDCGHPMERYRGMGDMDCPKCGAEHNSFGQRLAPRSQWGEETGELPSDIYGPDPESLGWPHEASDKPCPECGNVDSNDTRRCPVCGHSFLEDEAGESDPTGAPFPGGHMAKETGPEWLAEEIHTSGAKFTPMEQSEFIEEKGEARNMDKLALGGTHYEAAAEIEELFPFGSLGL